jgi:hypothetical protein
MPVFDKAYSIIHEAASADTTAHTYTLVYAGAAATPTINGTAVTMAAGSTLPIKVREISATANVYVLGSKADVYNGSTILG